MTGFGKAVIETPQRKITMEIRALNSKQLDINTRLPWLFREKEIEIRNLIGKVLSRGKIDLSVNFDSLEDEFIPVINKSAILNYHNQLTQIASELSIDISGRILEVIMRLPETMKQEKPELSPEEWSFFVDNLTDTLNKADQYRIEEGKALEKDLRAGILNIEQTLEIIEPLEGQRIEKIRERLLAMLKENSIPDQIDMNRFEQELLYYLEKIDINEEKVRLRQHCTYFIDVLENEESNGKKLGFITQEIGREINTIGSKANDAGIQQAVVRMKDDLEKIKEQVLNVL